MLLISCLTSGEDCVRQWTQWGPSAYGTHHVVLILSVCRVWHFNLCRVKRKEKKKGEGRKEGVYSWEGGGQIGLVRQAGLQDRALIILWPTAPCMIAEIPNRNFSCFPHTLVEERNFFSSRFREGRIMCVLEGQRSLSHTADRRAAREMRNMICSLKSLSR